MTPDAALAEPAAEVDTPRPWDNCTDPKPRAEPPIGYCDNCHGLMIVNESGTGWVHPPKDWKPAAEGGEQ